MQAIFAAGCFWGVESFFKEIDGVKSTRVGYIGGQLENPTYEQVCRDNTGHAEAIEITFDSEKISYNSLLQKFFEMHDPTQLNRQGVDTGTQYRSAVFYQDDTQKNAAAEMIEVLNNSGKFRSKIVTTLEPVSTFYEAEEYHQDYNAKNGGSCKI